MVIIISFIAVVALVQIVLFLFFALFAWRVPAPLPHGKRDRRVLVVIPAHNEESVITGILDDLSHQEYPNDLLEVHVIADRCTDATALLSESKAIVHERDEGVATKGAAVEWMFDRVSVDPDDLVVFVDADHRVEEDFVGRLCDGADEGFRVMQVRPEPANPDVSYVALAASMSQWISNRLIDLPRRNLGMSTGLHGSGFALVGDLIPVLTSAGQGLTEDQAIADALSIRGERIVWFHHVQVLDEKPRSVGVLLRQRSRWAKGKSLGRWQALIGLGIGPGPWSVSRADRIIRLMLPGRLIALVVLTSIALAALIWPSILAFSAWAILGVVALTVVISVAALVAEGAGLRRIVKIPILALFALLWAPERLIDRTSSEWYNTPHDGGT